MISTTSISCTYVCRVGPNLCAFDNLLITELFDLLCSLGPLVSKVKEYQVETIVDTLCNNMLSDKEQLRDISSIGEYLVNQATP